MRAIWKPLSIVSGLLLVLTYLLVQSATPDPVRHENTLQALHALTLNDAGLHRDVLQARTGLLRNYDPLVQTVTGLYGALDMLRAEVDLGSGEAAAEIGRHLETLATTLANEEALVESFKSDNALLQNSLMYFTHVSHELSASAIDERQAVAAEAGVLASAALQFLRNPEADPAGEVIASLERLARQPSEPSLESHIRTLVAHGRLIVEMLPKVDDVSSQLLSTPMAEQVQALQEAYLTQHHRVEARAQFFRISLYAASVVLLAYLVHLFLRLRANARALAERSSVLQTRLIFESLITEISTHFINLPSDRVDDSINQALGKLGQHTATDRAYIWSGADGTSTDVTHAWCRCWASIPLLMDRCGHLPMRAFPWQLDSFERQGCLHVPSVTALPAVAAKAYLEAQGIQSWLLVPIWCAGKPVGFLGFDAVRGEKYWSDDDIALIRTVGEIFANALERKRAEAEKETLEAQLRQLQRMEAIGTLAGGIAHDFNNILSAILGYSELAMGALPKGSRPQYYVQQVMTAGERAKAVINQILTFSRRSQHDYRLVVIQTLVEEAVQFLRASLPTSIAIRLRLDAKDATVLGDPTQLDQLMINLSTNAAQAMQGNGTLDIALDVVEIAEDRALSHGTMAAGRHIRLAVSDTGCGMDEATMERMFDPFFTTKAAGNGTGLGLSTVHGIVANHCGALNVHSQPSQGSTFEVYFPCSPCPDEVVISDSPIEATIPYGHGETILLVDDEKPLVLLGEEMLAALGYEAIGFDSASQALACFRANPQRFDLVLTDEVMPEMRGTQLAAALHQLRPELPVLLMTGYSGPVLSHELRAMGICEVLRKPLQSRDIAESLTQQLHPETGSGLNQNV
jgi:signal transduction histidine kinase/ActR/RegA family two-component response regulator